MYNESTRPENGFGQSKGVQKMNIRVMLIALVIMFMGGTVQADPDKYRFILNLPEGIVAKMADLADMEKAGHEIPSHNKFAYNQVLEGCILNHVSFNRILEYHGSWKAIKTENYRIKRICDRMFANK